MFQHHTPCLLMAPAPLLGLLLLFITPGNAAASPVVLWTSDPVLPGDAISVSGSGFVSACTINLTAASSGVEFSLIAEPGTLFDAALVVTLPVEAALDAYSLVVACPAGNSSPWWVNRAKPWWLQGDVGPDASPGGWVRVYGQTLALEPATRVAARKVARAAVRSLSTAGPTLGMNGLLGEAAKAAAAAEAAAAALALSPTTLRLTPTAGGTFIDITAANATAHAAVFLLPQALPLGVYNASVSNGAGGFTPLSTFISPQQPSVAGLSVVPPPAWPPGVFSVNATTIPTWGPDANTSDSALASALAAAAAAGGGTVLLSPGSFFLASPVLLPPNTLLRGAGREATKITFAEWNTTTAPAQPLFSVNNSAAAALGGAAWGVSDLEGRRRGTWVTVGA